MKQGEDIRPRLSRVCQLIRQSRSIQQRACVSLSLLWLWLWLISLPSSSYLVQDSIDSGITRFSNWLLNTSILHRQNTTPYTSLDTTSHSPHNTQATRITYEVSITAIRPRPLIKKKSSTDDKRPGEDENNTLNIDHGLPPRLR